MSNDKKAAARETAHPEKPEGPEPAIRATAGAVPAESPPTRQKRPVDDPGRPVAPFVELVRGDSLIPEAVAWLWNGYLVGGKINILAGAPGTGKTTLAMRMAATVTVGGPWPDGTIAEPGDVLIWSGEDGIRDVLVPRLLACGADMRRVRFVGRVFEEGKPRAFDPARDLPELREAMLAGGNWKLLIIDSIVSATTAKAGENAQTRRDLEPLGYLAEETGCAILGISHFTKGTSGREPLERVTGSLAFGAYARLVLATAKRSEEQGGRRIVTRAKSNLGPDGGGFVYDVEQIQIPDHPDIITSRVVWGDALEGTAREILADAESQEAEGEWGALAEAKAFLADVLADGPMLAIALKRECDGAGHSQATIRRAEKALGIESYREGGLGKSGKWFRRLPALSCSSKPLDAHQNGVSTLVKTEHLRPDVAEIEGTI